MAKATTTDQPVQTLLTDPPAPSGNLPARVDDSATLMFERLARDPAVDVEKLERLIAMQERVMRHTAKAAFDAAFADMQGELPVIAERGKTNNGKYATLEDIVETVRPVLTKHGFSLSHETQWPDAKTVRVVGILAHRQGHEKRSEFLSAADNSGNKNAIQGLGSAMSYGRRYTTLDLLNIVTRGADDDGRAATQVNRPDPPQKFEDWWDDMQLKAEDGLRALTKAFNESKPEYRTYLVRFHGSEWEALKGKAALVRK